MKRKTSLNSISYTFLLGFTMLASIEMAHAQVPIIQSVSPGSGSVGATVTLAGVNFSPILSNNIVWFGAVRGHVVSADTNNLEVTVPVGATYAPITITVNGLVAYANSAFEPKFSGDGPISASTFAPRQDKAAGANVFQTVVADLDGDSKPDLAAANIGNKTISLFRNVSTNGSLVAGSFARADFPAIITSEGPYGLCAGDVDGDGKIDLVFADSANNRVGVYRNISEMGSLTSNSFTVPVYFPVGVTPRSVRVRDIDGDGKPDILSCNNEGTISILRNIGASGSLDTNSFAARVNLISGTGAHDLAIQDLDGDDKPDLAIAHLNTSYISLFRNVGSPGAITTNSFAPRVELPAVANHFTVIAGDVDGDGKPDLLAGGKGATLSVYRNLASPGALSTNSFAAHVNFGNPGWVHTIALSDINGDGKSDISLVGELGSYMAVYQNLSTPGSFTTTSLAARVDFATGWNGWGISAGDLDGDNRPDIVFCNQYDNNLSLYRNITPYGGPPLILSHPASQTLPIGTNATFSVVVSGKQPLIYQWQFNGTNIGNAASSLILTNIQSSHSGSYSVLISNALGTITSSNALLTVGALPLITVQPESQNVPLGSNAIFNVTAAGDFLSYQWRFNGSNISTATDATYSITNVQSTNIGSYSVLVTNAFGATTSSVANLTISSPPIIIVQPQSQTVVAGSTVTLTVGASESDSPILPQANSGTLKLWLKADAGVVTVSNRVIQWQDQSPNGNHAAQSVANQQPLLIESGVPISGRPVVRFDGIQSPTTGDFLQGTGNVDVPSGYTSFAVYSRTDRVVQEQVIALVGVPGQYNSIRSYYIRSGFNPVDNEMAFSGWGNDYGTGFSIPANTFRIWTDRMNQTRTLLEFFDSDGVNSFSSASVSRNLASPSAGYYVGGCGNFVRNFQGDIAELIFYQGALSEADRLAVEEYLKQKYFTTSGSINFAYQWQFNGTNILGATNFSLTLTNVQPADAGNYSVFITNAAGSTLSSNALLTVVIPPSIDLQPQSQQVAQGDTATFSVTASSTNLLTYQWRFNGIAISNATQSAFSITNVQPFNAGAYSVLVSDGVVSVLSSNAILTVNFAPTITSHPQSRTAFTGTNVTFSVTATGHPLTYQWFFNSSNPISGATGSALVLASVSTNDAGNYSVLVSNSLGTATSSNALLTVINTASPIFEDFEPGIHHEQWSSFSPTVLATNYGGFVSASHSLWFGGSGSRFAATRPIDVSGGGSITFHLRLAGAASTNSSPNWEMVDLPGEGVVLEYSVNGTTWVIIATYSTTNYYNWTQIQTTVPPGAQSNATRFRWRQLANSGASTDHWALDDIQVLPASSAPTIVNQPQSRTVPVGTNVTLNVLATGQAPLSYQWLLDGNTLLASTNASLTLTSVQLSNSGDYSVVITNSFGTVTSATAVVTVLDPPAISLHPASVSTVQGSNVSFTVTASGSAPLAYQWRFNGVNISDATNATLVLTNVQGTNTGTYSVRITNPVGAVISSNAALTIDTFPVIVTQPQSQSVIQGTNVTFNVGVHTAAVFPTVNSGTLRLWLKADAGVVTNGSGLVSQWQDQSTNANHAFQSNTNKQPLFVNAAVPISSQPTIRFDGIQDVNNGDWMNGSNSVGIPTGYTSFMAYRRADRTIPEQAVVGIGIPAQQGALRSYFIRNSGEMAFSGWNEDRGTGFIIPANTYRIWTDRLSESKTVLEFFDVTTTNSTLFSRAISGLATPGAGYYIGGLNTYTRNFQGDISELIIYQGALSDSDRIAVENYLRQKYYESGSGVAVTYQWQFNGTNIAGATNSSITLSNVQPVYAGDYSVIVSNAAGATVSANAALTVNIPPSIATQPQNQAVNAGGFASFNVVATGTQPFSFQWQKNSTNLVGATNSTLLVGPVQLADAGEYRVIVTSPFGEVTSSNATLAVNITEIRVVNTSAPSASSFALPIQISALGTENAVGFSLSFDPALLTFNNVALDGTLTGALLLSNTDHLGSGKLGLAVALPADSTFAAGTHGLVQVTFNVGVTTNALNTSVNFADTPTLRQISDAGAEILPGVFANGTVAISAVDYEGDVAPRPNGNRTLTIVDWVQVGRFVAGLDSITNAAEFQRADCAPRSSLGNGALSVTDWVQAGRYATGLDPLTPAGGPDTAAKPGAAGTSMVAQNDEVTRTLILEPTNSVDQTHTISARLIAQGNENAIGFSLAFDPNVLTFSNATAGGNAPGALLNVNTNSLAHGRVGIALSLSTGNKFAAGTQEVIKLTFVAAPSATGSTPLTFADTPILREVSDTAANSLPTSFSNGTLVLSVPSPLLTIGKTEGGVLVSWPVTASNFVLETSSAVGTNWSSVTSGITTNAQSISTSLPLVEEQQLFRLKRP